MIGRSNTQCLFRQGSFRSSSCNWAHSVGRSSVLAFLSFFSASYLQTFRAFNCFFASRSKKRSTFETRRSMSFLFSFIYIHKSSFQFQEKEAKKSFSQKRRKRQFATTEAISQECGQKYTHDFFFALCDFSTHREKKCKQLKARCWEVRVRETRESSIKKTVRPAQAITSHIRKVVDTRSTC